MSSSISNTGIFLTDTREEILTKMKKFAQSGGRETLEEHKKYGGDLSKDVAYQYLRFFLEDDYELNQIGEDYQKGKLLSGELKKKMCKCDC